MKSPSPAFSFYPKDILSDEACAAMTDEELGVYVRFLCHAWLEGSIPDDICRLARIARRPRAAFGRLWEAIAPCWKASPDEPGRLVQGRLEVEREKQRVFSLRQSATARAGASKRIKTMVSTKDISHGSAAAQPQTSREAAGSCLPSPSPSPLRIERQNERTGAPANPLIQGRRVEVEREVLAMVREFSELEGEDPVEIIARASGYKGATTTKLNPATMSDDRLLNTWRDLKADLEEARRRKGTHGRQVRA